MLVNRVLIIGFGSIGQRHYSILSRIAGIDVAVLSRRSKALEDKNVMLFGDMISAFKQFKPTGVVVATETSNHYTVIESLLYYFSCSPFKIYLEKPLGLIEDYGAFCKMDQKFLKCINIGFDLRFDEGLLFVRNVIKSGLYGRILHVLIEVGQDLRQWRPNRDYRQTMSASANLGGGVLYDLSHELDFSSYLFGFPKKISSLIYNTGILEIDGCDVVKIIYFSNEDISVSISLDYHQKNVSRGLKIVFDRGDLYLDFIAKRIEFNKNEIFEYSSQSRDDRLLKSFEAFLNNDDSNICTFNQGLENLSFIKLAHENNII
jgi:predicted dehydrogenase